MIRRMSTWLHLPSRLLGAARLRGSALRGSARLRLPTGGRPAILVNVVLGVLAIGGGMWGYQTVHGQPAAAANRNTARTVRVSTGNVVATVSATGTVQSALTANADFATAGTVTEIDVKVGDPVTKGQVLAKVDPSAAQAQLNTAKANLTAAQASLNRAETATQPDAATIASAQAQVTQAQANVDSAQRGVDGTVLTAPIAGTVIGVNGAIGGSSSGSGATGAGSGASGSSGGGGNGGGSAGSGAGSSSSSGGFVKLADLTQMQISTYFAEADATKVKVGQAATIAWNALANTRATGSVATIAPTATTQNGVNSYAILISLSSVPAGVRIGQTTTVAVTVAEADNVLRVPSAAVRSAGGVHLVQLVVNGATQARAVQVGVQGDQFTEITSGLNAGDEIVASLATGTTANNGVPGFPGGGGFGGGGFGGGGFGGTGGRGGTGRTGTGGGQ
jgi:multidrug efflux pump subunit AcrA (membrane-fusion protein)